MKNTILVLVLLTLVIGCASQKENLSNKGPSEEPQLGDSQNTKTVEVYNPDTGENEIVNSPDTGVVETVTESFGDKLLKSVCKAAIDEYPDWVKLSTDIIIWEDADKSFYFRNSPEGMSSSLSSPVQTSETLADMDFVGLNEISYVKTDDKKWQIGLLKLKGLNTPDNSIVYERPEVVSLIDASPLNKEGFIVFYVKEKKAVLEQVNISNSKKLVLFETSVVSSNPKVSVSPKGMYAYLLYDRALKLFDISNKLNTDSIYPVSSAVWIGNYYLLYSNPEGTYIYDMVGKNSDKITGINAAEALAFNPKSEGIIAYTSNHKTRVVNCQNWKISLGSCEKGTVKTFTSEKTAILTKEDLSNSGYWRFEGDWYVKLSDKFSVLATMWSKY